MESLIIIIMIIAAITGLVWLLFLAHKSDKHNIYVYPKTKNVYFVKGIVKMKDTLSGEWIDAVLYVSQKTGEYYVRDKRQFLDKFVTLKEWEKKQNAGK